MRALEQYVLVAIGSAIGGCARFGLGAWVASRFGPSFPWGTFAINVSGSLVIGFFLALALERGIDPRWRLLVAVGFCGGYTTFSTFAHETAKLLDERQIGLALLNMAGSAVASVLAIYLGGLMGRR